MQILFVPHVYAPVVGGAQLYCRRLAEKLAAAGHSVSVITADLASAEGYYRFGVPPIGPHHEVVSGVSVHRLPFDTLPYRFGRFLGKQAVPTNRPQRWMMRLTHRAFTRRLDRAIREAGADVVVALPHLFVNVQSVLRLHRRRGFPLVLIPLLHESDPNWPVSEVRAAVESADAVLSLTAHERQRLVEGYGADPARVFVARPGVDAVEDSGDRGVARNRVLYLGRLSEAKGLAALRSAMGIVWQERADVEIILAGTPEPDWSDADWKEVPASVVVRPSEADKRDLITSSQCVVLPSKNESFGMVILESWAAGRPVIALDIPVLNETVTHGVDGYLAKPDSPDALAKAILNMVGHPDDADAMGAAGRGKALETFTWDVTANAALTALESAAGISRSDRH